MRKLKTIDLKTLEYKKSSLEIHNLEKINTIISEAITDYNLSVKWFL